VVFWRWKEGRALTCSSWSLNALVRNRITTEAAKFVTSSRWRLEDYFAKFQLCPKWAIKSRPSTSWSLWVSCRTCKPSEVSRVTFLTTFSPYFSSISTLLSFPYFLLSHFSWRFLKSVNRQKSFRTLFSKFLCYKTFSKRW